MIIRKQFKFEGGHIVRDCSSKRCSYSMHGHSFIVEVFFTSDGIDNGGMVMDFGLMKKTIGDFIDSFDHAWSMWNKEDKDYKKFIKENNLRWIEMPVTPSAEMYALMFFFVIDRIIENTVFQNGEKNVRLHSVRVHETATGYAEAFREDLKYWEWEMSDIVMSEDVINEHSDKDMWNKILDNSLFVNPKVDLKYQD